MNTFNTVIEYRDLVSLEVDILSSTLRTFPKSANGLTPDSVRSTTEFKTTKREFDKAFSELRRVNQIITRNFKKEYSNYRKEKRLSLTSGNK